MKSRDRDYNLLFPYFGDQVLLQGKRDRRLASAGQAREPDRASPEGVLAAASEYLTTLLAGNPGGAS